MVSTFAVCAQEKETSASLRVSEEEEQVDTEKYCEPIPEPKPISRQFKPGEWDVSPGIGLGATIGGTGVTTEIPALSVSVENAVSRRISIGGYAGVYAIGVTYTDGVTGVEVSGSYTYIIFGARASYHFKLIDHCDTYFGLLLAYNFGKATIADQSASAQAIIPGSFIGCRYRFAKNTAAFIEFGYGVTAVNIGMNFRF